MQRAGDEQRFPSEMQTEINDELMLAMGKLGATRREMQNVDARCPRDTYDILQALGARADLLLIVGSVCGAMNDRQVLENLHRWNTEEP